jgi:hypothetical protein
MGSRSARRVQTNYSQILTDVFELMIASGVPKSGILKMSNESLKRAQGRRIKVGGDISGILATAALVLDAWHRDRRYLTPKAKPRAVPLLGPSPSVEALIREQPGHRGAASLARRLKSQRLIVLHGNGLFKPAGDVALLSAFDPLAIQHVARSLAMLIATIRSNLAPSHAKDKLIERIAEVPDLPVGQVDSFRRFTQAQGWILLRTTNDWLEQRRAKNERKRGKVVRAGMHVHAYVGNLSTKP